MRESQYPIVTVINANDTIVFTQNPATDPKTVRIKAADFLNSVLNTLISMFGKPSVAIISQAGTDDPVVTMPVNTLPADPV